MKNLATAIMLAMLAGAPSVEAADKEISPQQQRMKDCNADAKAKDLKGDARKTFMKACLRGEKAAAADAKTANNEKTASTQ